MGKVLIGTDRLYTPKVRELLQGKRIGLVTGASGISSDYRQTVEAVAEGYTVFCIYAPEHGPRGVLGPGEKVHGGFDIQSGLPVRSLFEDMLFDHSCSPYTPQGLEDVDILVYDMQDVGSRYFTYVSTLFYCMKRAGEANIPLVVLDRPNPLGGEVEGPLNREEYSSFIGLTRVPIRHGMTVGELAKMYNGEYNLGCRLYVIECEGLKRDMYFEDTGLPFVKPSPNLPTLDSIAVYNGTCLFAGTNVSEGRGTTTPFTTIGAPYIDAVKLCKALEGKNIEGCRFSPAYFIPAFGKHCNSVCRGVNIHVTDKRRLKPVALGIKLLYTVRDMYKEFEFTLPKSGNRYHIDLSYGSPLLREGKMSEDEIILSWQRDREEFMPLYRKYMIYE